MDDYMFKLYVERCKYVQEATSYIEIYSYSDPSFNTVEEHRLADDDFDNWLQKKGAFTPRVLPNGVKQLGALRLVAQQDAKQPETFAPSVLSLKQEDYIQMVDTLKLPYRAIESTSVCGPFFWAALDQDEENAHIQIIYRKSDVKKKGMTRGWELVLSHDLRTSVTAGFIKGTPSSDVGACLRHLKECASQIQHPLLLPMIIFSHDMAPATDNKQRDARDWLRRLENAVSMRTEIQEKESYVDDRGVVDFDLINRHLVECHSQVLWKRPLAYIRILNSMQKAMDTFLDALETDKKRAVSKLHRSMLSRMDFYRHKLEGIDSYAHTTLQRLEVQRSALYNMIAQKESKLNFQMAGEQRKLAYASKRDSSAMKTISLLGAIFLPGAFLASLFSTTFFQFQFPSPTTIVSSDFYIFWACTIPITILVILIWYIWETRRDRRYRAEDEDLERGVEDMEADIMAMMRKRTMSKVSTWNDKGRAEEAVQNDDNRNGSSHGMHMPGGIHMPAGIHMPGTAGIHFHGTYKAHKRGDTLNDENNVKKDTQVPKPKVRIAENDDAGEGGGGKKKD